MKRIFFILTSVIFILSNFSLVVNGNDSSPLLIAEDEKVEYSPSGYTPKVQCKESELIPLITYFAIDKNNSSPVSVPIKSSGTYQIFAVFQGDESHPKEEVSYTVEILPIHAKILTPYNTAAYSKLENPIQYEVEPTWAKDYIDITIDYFPIETLVSPPKEKINVPIDLGLYYTVFNANSKDNNILCENKYMVYEISAYRGKKLSYEEQLQNIPKTFRCDFQDLSVVYDKSKCAVPSFTLTPAAITGSVMYKQIYSDGSYSNLFSTPPTEPGEYISEYFLENHSIGEGRIFIDKKEAVMSIESQIIEYSPLGITPSAHCEDEDAEIAFTAFVIDENGEITTVEEPIPIKKCGKYSIISYPKDTNHYKRTYAYGTLEITPSTPEITITKTEFIYDGKEKNVEIQPLPQGVFCKMEYFEWLDKENGIPLGTAPTRTGKYIVKITAYDKMGNYNTVSKTAIMYIDEPTKIEKTEKFNKTDAILLTLLGAIITGVVTASIIFATKSIKKREKNHEKK